jgi:lysophospholipid acyltransferase (LPLAT)-like uncharacterized protein
MAARSIEPLGLHAVRGSSSRGGSEALQQLEKALSLVPIVGFTVDGPKGPRREAKPGIAILAARTQTPIVPMTLVATRTWRLNSWDRFTVPLPFGRIVSACGPPIEPPSDDSGAAVEATRIQVDESLASLHLDLENRVGLATTDPRSDSGSSTD